METSRIFTRTKLGLTTYSLNEFSVHTANIDTNRREANFHIPLRDWREHGTNDQLGSFKFYNVCRGGASQVV